ncbi:MAG TPA: CBS domain-containing protein [Geobacteraceae bacterium]|nr:CBS domain-containing protein [Geobacteraceae bacterium]
MKAKDIMVADFPVIPASTPIEEAVHILRSSHDESYLHASPGLIVVNDKGDLAGILSPLTIVRVLLDVAAEVENVSPGGKPSLDALCSRIKGKTVEDVMDWQPISVTEDAHILDVADLFVKNRFQRIPVVKGKKVIGIIFRSRLLFFMTQCFD